MASVAPLYIVMLEDHFDDYKRADTISSVVGVFSSRERAFKVAILRLIEVMQEHIEDGERANPKIAKKLDSFCRACKGDAFDVSKGLQDAQDLIEKVYGEPDFCTTKASGIRFFVQEVRAVIDQTVEGDHLGEDFDKKWADKISLDSEDGSQEPASEGAAESEEDGYTEIVEGLAAKRSKKN